MLAPLAGVVLAALGESGADIPTRDLVRYATTTAVLAGLVGLVTGVIGAAAAWLVVMHRFPGRDLFAWGLALPLAMPAFAVAYGYADLLDVAGPLRVGLREWTGYDLPFEIRTTGGAAFVLSAAFYPYVYLAMRAALLNLPGSALDAATMLGRRGLCAFFTVALPLTRPALGAGVALAVMETLADYGAVRFLSVQTLTTGVVRAWSVYGSTVDAARLALPLLAAAALLLWVERAGRTGRIHESGKSSWRSQQATALRGLPAAAACGFCLLLITAGLLAPAGWLVAQLPLADPDWTRLWRAAGNTVGLSAAGAVVTVGLATLLALGGRTLPMATRLASLGYATPGAVMAIGLLAPASLVWALSAGPGAGLALGLLILAYASRLMAAALEPIDAGLARVNPALPQAARNLGRGEAGTALSVSLPLARGSLLTAGLIVLVDIMKELPATLILRPFNFDTLAVLSSNYALDERLGQAGLPSLMILALSAPAVVWLTLRIESPAQELSR
ncbi:iron ABC transporter permease [Phenylobacterium sp.]|uniref:ABC transporter permease n=1 Tax=Phenylobacterium sp. TaxID=1871053 RepID=UPI0025D37549|nr:iron ABC transporter permease [Phenylobacterium sp.]MCA3721390.1 iron ABC transporter permease [Phenylobacterium sp.]